MNWLVRLGMWLEKRRKITREEFDAMSAFTAERLAGRVPMAELADVLRRLDAAEEKLETPLVAGDVVKLKMQVNRLELFVGLQREAKPVALPDAPKIG